MINLEPICEENICQLKSLHVQILPVQYLETFYRQLLTDSNKISYLFRNGNSVVLGGCSVVIRERKAYLMTFGLLAHYRGMGYGTCCLRKVEYLLRYSYGARGTYLHVQSSNLTARQFYQKMGYSAVSMELNYYKNLKVNSAIVFDKTFF